MKETLVVIAIYVAVLAFSALLASCEPVQQAPEPSPVSTEQLFRFWHSNV